jgi:hydroxymethylglutaryl-CoA lyase
MERPDDIKIVEVGPRDGLQNLDMFVATGDKVALIRSLAAAGIREIQAGGFVNPRAIPQFKDMKEVIDGLDGLREVTLQVMVPNLKGAEAAVASGIDKIVYFFSVSRSHNLNNVRQTPEESLAALASIIGCAKGTKTAIRVDLATVFGCPFEGVIARDVIAGYIEKVARHGIGEVTLCDTVGVGNPRQVEDVLVFCRQRFPEIIFGVHFHNTRGQGLANALRAYDVGVRSFDAAIGGLGGCPFAPGASGNVATEDVAFMFGEMGLKTGIDMERLLEASRLLHAVLPNVPLKSAVFQAGLPRVFEFKQTANNQEGEMTRC